jgi:hypothetical protein
MEALKMVYTEHIGSRYPFLLLNVINDGNIAIIRTISTGVPHWIIPVSYVDNIYNINDPWLGRIQYRGIKSNLGYKRLSIFEIKTMEIKIGVPIEKRVEFANWAYPL